MSATSVLFKEGFVKWLRTRGLLMILAVALIPPALTAAWVGTHDADMAVIDISWDPGIPKAGDNVTISAVIENVYSTPVEPFDVVLRIGSYREDAQGQINWVNNHNETLSVDGLEPGDRRSVSTVWNAQPGNWRVEAWADFFEVKNKEVEKLNNHRWVKMNVAPATERHQFPTVPDTTEDENATAPNATLSIGEVAWSPEQIFDQDNVSFTIPVENEGPEDVTNVSVTFQLFEINPITGQLEIDPRTGQPRHVVNRTETTDLLAGDTEVFTFTHDRIRMYPNTQVGLYVFLALIEAETAPGTAEQGDRVVVQQLPPVEPKNLYREPEERATAKDFYRNQVLLPLHFTLLVPLIGLFFAGGVLQDERQRGNLIYVLTRPVPRWSLPVSRFASGFLVALLAVLVGVFATFLIIMGTPQQAPGFLWWPLVFGVLVLFLYGSVFTFVGVVSDRPYLVGLLYVLGFESLVLAGRRILVNGEYLVQDWVLNFSLMHWVTTAFEGWDPKDPSLLPVGDEATRAFFVILGIGIVALVAAAVAATRRQFPE